MREYISILISIHSAGAGLLPPSFTNLPAITLPLPSSIMATGVGEIVTGIDVTTGVEDGITTTTTTTRATGMVMMMLVIIIDA